MSGNGVIKVDNRFVAENAQRPMIPRVGLRMQLPARITSLTYYGRGPEENYRDRRTSQFSGGYTSGIKDMYEPYVRPQENNHRTDIYWCTLTDKAQEGLLFVADRTFEMNVSIYPLPPHRSATGTFGRFLLGLPHDGRRRRQQLGSFGS